MAKKRVPAALMIDDGAPVNLMVWHCPWEPHVKLVPNRLAAGDALGGPAGLKTSGALQSPHAPEH